MGFKPSIPLKKKIDKATPREARKIIQAQKSIEGWRGFSLTTRESAMNDVRLAMDSQGMEYNHFLVCLIADIARHVQPGVYAATIDYEVKLRCKRAKVKVKTYAERVGAIVHKDCQHLERVRGKCLKCSKVM